MPSSVVMDQLLCLPEPFDSLRTASRGAGTSYPCWQATLFSVLHHDLVVVYRDISLRIDRSQLVLCRSNFVMLCLRRNSDFPQLFIDIFHECRNSLRSARLFIELLSFRRHCSEQCTSCIDQVFSLFKLLSVYEEILLLRSYGRCNFLRCRISKQS